MRKAIKQRLTRVPRVARSWVALAALDAVFIALAVFVLVRWEWPGWIWFAWGVVIGVVADLIGSWWEGIDNEEEAP